MKVLTMFIRQRGKKYHVIAEYRDSDDRRKQKSVGSYDSKRVADKELVKAKAKYLNNDFIIPNKLELETYINAWFNEHKKTLSITTANRYEGIINELNKFIGKEELQKITPLMIKQFYNSLDQVTSTRKKGLSEKTKLQYHRVICKAFKDAFKMQYINKNIMELVDAPKPKKFVANFLTPLETKEIIEGLKGSRYEVPFNLAVGLGLRASEICGLHWDKVDFDKKLITIDTVSVWDEKKKTAVFKGPKSETSFRALTCPEKIIDLLKVHKEQQKELGLDYLGLVFTNENGTQATSRSFNTPYRNYIKRRKLPDVRFHDLRHTNASLMLLGGVELKTASSRLGHSQIGITMDLYTHVLQELHVAASDTISNILYE